MNIAVIGSGITGLVAAWMLGQDHDVTLFERETAPGLVANSFRTRVGQIDIRGDVPSRMFNRLEWPTFCRLLDHLEIGCEPIEPSITIYDPDGRPVLRTRNALRPWQTGLTNILRPSARPILRDARRLYSEGRVDADHESLQSTTMQQYLSERHYSPDFIHGFLYPLLSSTVCTCSHRALAEYPASIMLSSLRNLTDPQAPLSRVQNGIDSLTDRMLSESCFDLRLATPIQSIQPGQHRVLLRTNESGGAVVDEAYDHVVVTVQANHVLRLIRDLPPHLASLLSAIPYENIAVQILDESCEELRAQKHLQMFNIWPPVQKGDSSRCVVWMNRFHREWPTCPAFFQSIQPLGDVSHDALRDAPNPGHVALLQRPIVSIRSWEIWRGLAEATGSRQRRIWLSGSYAEPGIPLLETAVRSVVRVVSWIDPENERAALLSCDNRLHPTSRPT